MLESLTGHRYLFPASIAVPGSRRPNDEHARKSAQVNADIDAFIAWVNTTFRAPGGTPPIPPDPQGRVHAARLRRTLAYFIVRRPRGLIAAALQYAHVSTKVTPSYSGYADTSWMDDLAIERLEMVIDQIGDDLARLEDGEHVSGPSAVQYRARIARASRFSGRAVTGVRNAQPLLTQADPNIHHGEAMTCVWRPETAACRKAKLEQGLPADNAPDASECQTTCTNLAYSDRDIQKRDERAAIRDQVSLQEKQADEARVFQRETLLELHDLLYKLNRNSGAAEHIDEMRYRETGKFRRDLLPEDVSDDFTVLLTTISRLRVRIFDVKLRERIEKYTNKTVELGRCSGQRKEGDDAEQYARAQRLEREVLSQYGPLEEALGIAIRSQFPGSDLSPLSNLKQ